VRPAGADGEDSIIRLDDVTGAGNDEAVLTIGDGEQSLETAQHAIAPPILGELYSGALEITRISLQLLLEFLEQSERVCRRPGESSQQLAAVESPHLLGVGFHHRLADGHLAVAAKGDLPVPANGENSCGADT